MKKNKDITVYSAEDSRLSIVSYLQDILNIFPQAHELGFRLFKRNLKALYRQSLLGFVWALLPPLATASLWILLRGSNVVAMPDTGIPYPLFVLTGTFLWQIFHEALSAPLAQVTENRAMLSKINIPREGLLLAGVYQWLFNVVVKLLLLALIYLYFRQATHLSGLFFALVGVGALGLAGFSVGLALTPLGMLYRDIDRGLAVLLPFFMYLTPVVYPAPAGGLIASLMRWNPVAPLLVQTRNGLTAQPLSDLGLFFGFTLAFALLFIIGLVIYRLSMPIIIERIGS